MSKIIAYAKKHKIITAVMILVLIGGGYYAYGKFLGSQAKVSYLTAAAAKGTLITSVSGSGQISNSNQIDLKPKVSGGIIKVAVVAGQSVKQGDVIVQIDATDAYKTVRDAQANLQSAQLALDKLKQPATAEAKLQAQNSLTSAQTALDKLKLSQPVDLQNAKDSLNKSYNDAFTAVSNVYLNFPTIISSLYDILYSTQISSSETSISRGQVNTDALYNSTYQSDQDKIKSFETTAKADYVAVKKVYDSSYADFKLASVYSDQATVDNLLSGTLVTAKALAQAVKSQNNYLIAWSDSRTLYNSSIFSQVTTYKTNLTTYAGQVNSGITNLTSVQTTLRDDKDTLAALAQNQPLDLAAAENAIKEKQSSLASLLAGADELDIKTQELNVQQRRNALYDTQAALTDYTIRAPFDGVIATVGAKVGDSASSATALATIVTEQQIAEISLNEVDAAKIKPGQKVTLTFDAIEDLEITGKVAQVDAIGTVSQGVVTYTIKIILDTQDQRIKSGMSVNAAIITNVKADVLIVPNSAVKIDATGLSYVQTLDAQGKPQNITVQIGLVNDTNTEITSGLNEGDKVITQTINASVGQSSKTGSSAAAGLGGASRVFIGR